MNQRPTRCGNPMCIARRQIHGLECDGRCRAAATIRPKQIADEHQGVYIGGNAGASAHAGVSAGAEACAGAEASASASERARRNADVAVNAGAGARVSTRAVAVSTPVLRSGSHAVDEPAIISIPARAPRGDCTCELPRSAGVDTAQPGVVESWHVASTSRTIDGMHETKIAVTFRDGLYVSTRTFAHKSKNPVDPRDVFREISHKHGFEFAVRDECDMRGQNSRRMDSIDTTVRQMYDTILANSEKIDGCIRLLESLASHARPIANQQVGHVAPEKRGRTDSQFRVGFTPPKKRKIE